MPHSPARHIAPQVTSWAPRSPVQRPNNPAMMAATSGRKTAAMLTSISALHQVDVFDFDGAAIAEIDEQDGEADRRLGGRDGQHEHGEDLADEIMQEGREGNEVDIDREQDQLDRHQDDDDVLAVEKDAENAQGKEHCGDGEIVGKADFEHSVQTPFPISTLTTSTEAARVR